MAYDNTNSGTLFKNEKKEREAHPDSRGEAEVVCPHCNNTNAYWLSAWTNLIKNGKRTGQKMLSLKFSLKEGKPAAQTNSTIGEEDIPF
jgi:hypothetical protein